MNGSADATVLVVDDEPLVADTYQRQLSGTYDVHTVYDGHEALAAVDESVDVVLLDRRMPSLSGSEVLAEIRDRGLDCAVVMVTAVDPDFDVIDMEFDDYLVKPVTGEELREAIERALSRTTYRELAREYFRLASTHAALEASKSRAELDASEEFADLEERIESLERELAAAEAEFDSEDFGTMYRELL